MTCLFRVFDVGVIPMDGFVIACSPRAAKVALDDRCANRAVIATSWSSLEFPADE